MDIKRKTLNLVSQISIIKMEMTSKRDNTLDCACGILIIHMILGHIFQWSQLTTTHFYQWMNILYFFMPWFFFKAGIFYKKTPVKKVFSTSFHRLIVPFYCLVPHRARFFMYKFGARRRPYVAGFFNKPNERHPSTWVYNR